jgi:hypothetical protein
MTPTSLRVFSVASLAMVVAFPLYLPRTDLGPLQAELLALEQRLVAVQAAGKQHQYELKVQQEVMHASLGYLSQTSQACDAIYDEIDGMAEELAELKQQVAATPPQGPRAGDVEVLTVAPRSTQQMPSAQRGSSKASSVSKPARTTGSRKPRTYVWMRSILPTHIGPPGK